jgi:ubiquinone/menaquinone biosynthesis C-methylase UbiE
MKRAVYEYWNKSPCNVSLSDKTKFTRDYFDEVEETRYSQEPFIWSFAQFSRYSGKKILEIGVGIGTDFIQWVRSGCIATGCDLTPAAVDITKKRLEAYGLSAVVQQEDCEGLTFADGTFDVVYSWGVLHHTPNTEKAISEVFRVLKKGGIAKIMLYNRYSLHFLSIWFRYGLMRLKPFASADALAARYYFESPGTKFYSPRQIKAMFRSFSQVNICTQSAAYDYEVIPKLLRLPIFKFFIHIFAGKIGWAHLVTAVK